MREKVVLFLFALVLLVGAQVDAAAAASGDESPTRLYSLDAERGTLVPTGKRDGEYALTLRGVEPRAFWFQNRPGSLEGSTSYTQLLKLLFDRDAAPTSAAIDAWDPKRRDDVVMGVELRGGSWNPRLRILRFQVIDLRASAGKEAGRVGVRLPRRFAEAGLFIDDVCPARFCGVSGTTDLRGRDVGKAFVQDAARGTLGPTGKNGTRWLTLRGVKPRTLWFQDRPGTLAGTVSHEEVLDAFFADAGEAPPNAAIDAWDPKRRDDVTVGLKVLDGKWDAERRTLRYLVRPLRAAAGSGPPAELPRRFSQAAFFIDDFECNARCAESIGTLYGYLDNFFTERNTCTGILSNESGGPLYWQDDYTNDDNSWAQNPARTVPYPITSFEYGQSTWTTVGGWLHGCYAFVHYARKGGPDVKMGIVDPYRGANEWGCGVSAGYSCYLERGNFSGNHLIIYWCVLPSSEAPLETCPNAGE